MRFSCLAIRFSSFDCQAIRCNFTSYVRAFCILTRLDWWWFSGTVTLPAKAGVVKCRAKNVRRHHTRFSCVKCSWLAKTKKFNCNYAASASRRIHASARKKAHKMWTTSPARRRLTYLHIEREITRVVIAILPAIAGVFVLECVSFCLPNERSFCQ